MPLSWVNKALVTKKQKKHGKSRASGSGKAKSKAAAKPKVTRKRKATTPASAPKPEEVIAPKTSDPFDLEGFIRKAWQLGGYVPVENPGLAKLLLASGCAGSGSFASVSKKMLRVAGGKVRGVELYGTDWSASAQQFLLRNHRAGGCLFQDVGRASPILFSKHVGGPASQTGVLDLFSFPKRMFWLNLLLQNDRFGFFPPPKRAFWFHFLFPNGCFGCTFSSKTVALVLVSFSKTCAWASLKTPSSTSR